MVGVVGAIPTTTPESGATRGRGGIGLRARAVSTTLRLLRSPLRPDIENENEEDNAHSRACRNPGGLAALAALVFAFACLSSPRPVPAAKPTFDAARAMGDLVAQCDFGPRVPGTEPHAKCLDWIVERFREAGRIVEPQSFDARLAVSGKTARATNLFGLPVRVDPSDPSYSIQDRDAPGNALVAPVIVVSAHWDTRPVADNDPAGTPRTVPFLGANDGASGVAVVLELARAIRGTPLEPRVAFALWDAEDSGMNRDLATWCLGARHAAEHPPAWWEKVRLGVNLDMVGGRGMKLGPEVDSQRAAPGPVGRLWRIGRDLAPGVFVGRPVGPIYDDHVPFIEKGLPYLDVIGLPYEHWHRSTDTPGACDPASLDAVGRAMLEFLKREIAILDREARETPVASPALAP